MLKRLVKSSRIIIVGDPKQSIYSFRGAVTGGMHALSFAHNTSPLDLSTSFRCPSAIVENLLDGTFQTSSVSEKVEVSSTSPNLTLEEWGKIAPSYVETTRLFSHLHSVYSLWEGLCQWQDQILDQSSSTLCVGSELRTYHDPQFSGAIDDWTAEREAKGSASAADMGGCMRVFAEHGADLGQATCWYAEHIFAQKGLHPAS